MKPNAPINGRSRRRTPFAVAPLIERESLDRFLFLPRYVAVLALAAVCVAVSGSTLWLAVLLVLVGVTISFLAQRFARRTGLLPVWMPFLDVTACVLFAFLAKPLLLPAAMVGLAIITLASAVYGERTALATTLVGTIGFSLVSAVGDHPDRVAVTIGLGVTGAIVSIIVGRMAMEGAASRNRLDHLVENVDAVLWIAEPPAEGFTFVSRRQTGSLGWPAERWGDLDFWRRNVHPEDRVAVVGLFTESMAAGTDIDVRYRFRSASGAWRTMHDRVTASRDDSGRIKAYYGMSLDVTDQVEIEQRIDRYADIVDRIDLALLVVEAVDDHLELAAANPASEALLGKPLSGLVGLPLSEVFPTTAGNVMQDRLQDVVTTGRSLEVDGIVVPGEAGSPRIIALRAFPLPGRAAALSLTDVTEAEAAAEALRRQANYDELTGLPNRRVMEEELARVVGACPDSGERVALLMMDLDQFKEVNDALGHHVGDQLLRRIGDRLASIIDDALIARLGGDEFAVLMVGMVDEEQAHTVAEKVRATLSEPFLVDDIRLQSNASIGIALYPDHASGPDTLVRRADIAMYNAKRSGKGIAFYDPDLDRSSVTRLTLISDLRDAVTDGQLVLHFQPFIDLRTGRVTRAEALLRWQHPTWGLLYPDEFVELASLTDVIQPLTRWVLTAGLQAAQEWRRHGHDFGLAVNLSVRNLYDPGLVTHLDDLLTATGTAPGDLILELTESELMDDAGLAREVFHSLRALGVKTSIDDFGTGYSSMTFLRDLPLSEIKVDRSFVQHMHESADDFTIVRSMIDLGHNLGLDVVGEGVETEDQLLPLIELGCDAAQGFLFSRPLPLDDLLAWLDANDAGTWPVDFGDRQPLDEVRTAGM